RAGLRSETPNAPPLLMRAPGPPPGVSPFTEEHPPMINLQHLARWSSALALVASLAWADEPTAAPAAQPAPEGAPAPAPSPAPAPEAAAAPVAVGRVLRGRIVDAKNKDGLPAATVSVKGTNLSAGVDDTGTFTLSGVPEGRLTLHVEEQDHVRRD